jgi:biotin operon repressor
MIDACPGVSAAELAGRLGRDRASFKADVRKLKELGLTESLRTGYRLSPRGRIVRERLDQADRPIS